MPNYTVTHISKTPLVGAPGRIAHFINLQENFESIHIYLRDYPNHLKGLFTNNSFLWDEKDICKTKYLMMHIEKTHIFHIHNEINEEFQKLILRLNPKSKKVYHVHSPLREGPLFTDISESFLFSFDKKCCVNQLHPRLYNNFCPMPNIIAETPRNFSPNTEKLSILFCPTHKGTGRYNTKYSEKTTIILDKLSNSGHFEVIRPPYIPPLLLSEIRRHSNFALDEIASGGFHQASLEALAAGVVAINNADYLAKDFYARSIHATECPPFLQCSDDSLYDILINMKDNKDYVYDLQKKSYDYFHRFMKPERLAQIYTTMYKELLAS